MPALDQIVDINVDNRTLAMLQQRINDLSTKTPNSKKNKKALVDAKSDVSNAWASFSVALLTEKAREREEKTNEAFHYMLHGYIDLTKWRIFQIKVFVKKKTRWLKNDDIERAMSDYYDSIKKAEEKIKELQENRELSTTQKIQLLDQTNDHCKAALNHLDEYKLKIFVKKNQTALLLDTLKAIGAFLSGVLSTLLVQYFSQASK